MKIITLISYYIVHGYLSIKKVDTNIAYQNRALLWYKYNTLPILTRSLYGKQIMNIFTSKDYIIIHLKLSAEFGIFNDLILISKLCHFQ